MKKQALVVALIIYLFYPQIGYGQNEKENNSLELSELFLEDGILPISISYSNKDIKRKTNDSTFITTFLSFKMQNGTWDSLQVNLRKRGNYRLKNCYYAPIKVKIKKKDSKNTLFESHKNLKLVMPCMREKNRDDQIVKEYIAYKLYEVVSPYHFKSRLVDVDYDQVLGKKIKSQKVKGILIEDDKHVAKRVGGKVWDRKVHPLNQMDYESVRNAFFQYMISNTDFSNAYSHNSKLIFLEGEIIPVPYDFDMSGLVNSSYSVVSQINNQSLSIEKVTDRLYRGFVRDPQVYTNVRLEYIANRLALLEVVENCEDLFDSAKEYEATLKFVNGFFNIITNDNKFEELILNKARTK